MKLSLLSTKHSGLSTSVIACYCLIRPVIRLFCLVQDGSLSREIFAIKFCLLYQANRQITFHQ